MASREEFEYEALQDTQAVVSYLQALADGFSRGDLRLGTDGRALELRPNGLLRFRLEGRRSKSRARLVITVTWKQSRPGEDKPSAPLEISSNTP